MRRIWLPLALLVALTTLLAGSASATQLKYTGQAYVPSFGSYYVGAYSAKINPTDAAWASNSANWNSQPTVAAICNDFTGRISTGDVWNVAVYELAATDLEGAKFWGDAVSGDAVTRDNNTIDLVDYQAAAWLSDQLLAYHYNWSPTTANLERTHIQYAIWSIFDLTAIASRTTTQVTAINAYRQAAFDAVSSGYTGDAWRVFTEIPATGPKQEMLIRVPEAASFASLGLNFGALALLGYVFRRRMN
jgi:hypothetical protein